MIVVSLARNTVTVASASTCLLEESLSVPFTTPELFCALALIKEKNNRLAVREILSIGMGGCLAWGGYD
jgi:hypothetical protein